MRDEGNVGTAAYPLVRIRTDYSRVFTEGKAVICRVSRPERIFCLIALTSRLVLQTRHGYGNMKAMKNRFPYRTARRVHWGQMAWRSRCTHFHQGMRHNLSST